jgi:hypothetical protein
MQEELDRHKKTLRKKEERKREKMFQVDLEREREKRDIKGRYMTSRMVSLLQSDPPCRESKQRSSDVSPSSKRRCKRETPCVRSLSSHAWTTSTTSRVT